MSVTRPSKKPGTSSRQPRNDTCGYERDAAPVRPRRHGAPGSGPAARAGHPLASRLGEWRHSHAPIPLAGARLARAGGWRDHECHACGRSPRPAPGAKCDSAERENSGEGVMPTSEEYRQLPTSARLGRLERTPDELDKMIAGRSADDLAKRPDLKSWAPTEIVCHLRDVEETFQARFHMIVALDEPQILV